jgi:hypothetical protein
MLKPHIDDSALEAKFVLLGSLLYFALKSPSPHVELDDGVVEELPWSQAAQLFPMDGQGIHVSADTATAS